MAIQCDDHMRMLRKKECVQKEPIFYVPQRLDGNLIHVKHEERPFGVFYIETKGQNCAEFAPANVMDFAIRVIDRNNRQHNRYSVFQAVANTSYAVPVTADVLKSSSKNGSTQSLPSQIEAKPLRQEEYEPVDEFQEIDSAESENRDRKNRRDSYEATANEVEFPVFSSINRKSRSPYYNYYGSNESINTLKTNDPSVQSVGRLTLLRSQSSVDLTSPAISMLPMPQRPRASTLYSGLSLARDSSAIPPLLPHPPLPPRPLPIYLDASQPLHSPPTAIRPASKEPIEYLGFSHSQSSLELGKTETDATLPSPPPSILPCRPRCTSESRLSLKLLALSTGLTHIMPTSPPAASEIDGIPNHTPIE